MTCACCRSDLLCLYVTRAALPFSSRDFLMRWREVVGGGGEWCIRILTVSALPAVCRCNYDFTTEFPLLNENRTFLWCNRQFDIYIMILGFYRVRSFTCKKRRNSAFVRC